MAAVNKLVSCGLVTIILAAAGCSPSATNKPEPGAASSAPAKPAAQSPGEGQRGATGESTTRGNRVWISCGKESRQLLLRRARSRRFSLVSTVMIWKARRAKRSK